MKYFVTGLLKFIFMFPYAFIVLCLGLIVDAQEMGGQSSYKYNLLDKFTNWVEEFYKPKQEI